MYESEEIAKLAGYHHDHKRCRYHWKQRDSSNLLVTVGDSFTRGCGLEPWEWRDLYGAQLSEKRNYDWINAGCAGGSNSWSLNFLDSAIDFLNRARYSNGAVILTLTENGRDIMEGKSRKFDYRTFYSHLPVNGELLDRVLDDVELEWVDRILNIRSRLDPRFRLLIGNNFAWHEKLYKKLQKLDGIAVLENNWVSLMPGTSKVPLIRSTIFSVCMKELLNIIGSNITDEYKQWILDQSSGVISLIDSISDRKEFFCDHDLGHPNVRGHQIWAEYLDRFF